MTFTKATKRAAKLRLAIAGPSGGGKTYSSLAIGTALAEMEGGRVAFVDTEHGSASKYADIFDFDVLEMTAPFHPDRFVQALQDAAAAGYPVVILDSLSHAWNGPGGLLEIVDEIAKRQRSSANTFSAWKDATPIQNRLVEALLSTQVHIIAAMRAKQEYVIEQEERNGRIVNVPKKLGMAPVQRDSFEYEFDVFGEMDMQNNLIVSKTRCPALAGRVIAKPGRELAETLRAWLSDGAPAVDLDAEPRPTISDRISALIAKFADPAVELTAGQRKIVKIATSVAHAKDAHPAHLAEALDRLEKIDQEVSSLNGASA